MVAKGFGTNAALTTMGMPAGKMLAGPAATTATTAGAGTAKEPGLGFATVCSKLSFFCVNAYIILTLSIYRYLDFLIPSSLCLRGCLIKKFSNVLLNNAKVVNPTVKLQAKVQKDFSLSLK